MKRSIKIYLYILLGIFLNCAETTIENNIRVLVSGKVVDGNSMPINDAFITVSTDADAVGAVERILATGRSDTFGNFNITSLFGGNTIFQIKVEYNNNYSNYYYITNTENFRPENLVFDLQTITLKQLSNFRYNIGRTSGLGNSLDFSFKYVDPFCKEVFNEGVIDMEMSRCFEDSFRSRTLNDNFPEDSRSIVIPLNSEVEFRYKVNDGEEQVEIINVNTIDYVFNFNY